MADIQASIDLCFEKANGLFIIFLIEVNKEFGLEAHRNAAFYEWDERYGVPDA